jgi:predicted phosphodiesterase
VKIGILSDSHDDMAAIAKAVVVLETETREARIVEL